MIKLQILSNHHVFSISHSGSFHPLLPNAPENNPTLFFPQFAGNDLTTARKRNVKHSLELFVTSEHRGGPCSSASLDIPDHTQRKLPTAAVNCSCLPPTPKQPWQHTQPPPSPGTIPHIWAFSGVLMRAENSVLWYLKSMSKIDETYF